jgi:hypothetical protein
MKARPRRVEREVAARLSEAFTAAGLSPVQRIPVLGRTGPDITCNEARFIIDVKSRIEVPKMYLPEGDQPILILDDWLVAFRLDMFGQFLTGWRRIAARVEGSSKTVRNWYDHLDEWTARNEPDGITMLVLHKSGANGHGPMPIGHSAVVLNQSDYQNFTLRRSK